MRRGLAFYALGALATFVAAFYGALEVGCWYFGRRWRGGHRPGLGMR